MVLFMTCQFGFNIYQLFERSNTIITGTGKVIESIVNLKFNYDMCFQIDNNYRSNTAHDAHATMCCLVRKTTNRCRLRH